MAFDDRYRYILGEDAGAEDAIGRGRSLAVGLDNGRVIFAIGTGEDVPVDTRAWVTMPDHVADKLAYHLLAAAEEIRRQRRQT